MRAHEPTTSATGQGATTASGTMDIRPAITKANELPARAAQL
jgi:hypothetical protein